MVASRGKPRAHRGSDWFGLCYAGRPVRRAIETIPNFFANLRAHVRIRRSRAICARRRALYRPAVRRLRPREPCAQTRHTQATPECKLWTGPPERDADRLRFVRELFPRKLPAPGSSIASTPASKSPGRPRTLPVPLVPCARVASQSTRKRKPLDTKDKLQRSTHSK